MSVCSLTSGMSSFLSTVLLRSEMEDDVSARPADDGASFCRFSLYAFQERKIKTRIKETMTIKSTFDQGRGMYMG